LTSTPAATFTHDGNGNTLTKADSTGTTQYTWDFENRLSSVVLPAAGTVTFKYDPFGRRIQKSSASSTTNYLYDGSNSIEEVDAGGGQLARYAQGAGIDEPLAESRGGTNGFYEQDGLGSVTSLSGSAGALADTYTYNAFGVLTASSGSLTNPFQYTGRDFDSETGLRYYRARYYAPAVGRFLSEDPAEFLGGVNFYAYVTNNPQALVDPSGLCPPKKSKPECFAQLKYRPTGPGELLKTAQNHYFWWVQDSQGFQTVISAGVDGRSPYLQAFHTYSYKIRPDNGLGPNQDFVTSSVWFDSGLSSDLCDRVDKMLIYADRWPKNLVTYYYQGPNSNSFAHRIGDVGGFSIPPPPGQWGWDSPLPKP